MSDAWPPRHEFSLDWLMRAVSEGAAKVSDTEITLEFDNASAVYEIVIDDDHPTTGMWGYLKKGKVG
jgi:hypothetical protein